MKLAEVPAGSGEGSGPDAALRDLADRLMAAYQADPSNAALAREARVTLLTLSPRRDDAVQAELDAFISDLSKPVYTTDDYS